MAETETEIETGIGIVTMTVIRTGTGIGTATATETAEGTATRTETAIVATEETRVTFFSYRGVQTNFFSDRFSHDLGRPRRGGGGGGGGGDHWEPEERRNGEVGVIAIRGNRFFFILIFFNLSSVELNARVPALALVLDVDRLLLVADHVAPVPEPGPTHVLVLAPAVVIVKPWILLLAH